MGGKLVPIESSISSLRKVFAFLHLILWLSNILTGIFYLGRLYSICVVKIRDPFHFSFFHIFLSRKQS